LTIIDNIERIIASFLNTKEEGGEKIGIKTPTQQKEEERRKK